MGVDALSAYWAWDYLGVMTKCPGPADTQTKTCLLREMQVSYRLAPLATSGTCYTVDLFLAGRRRSVVVTLPIMCCSISDPSIWSISYHPSSPVAQSLIRSWDLQAPLLIPLACIDNPASPLHTRTLAHALQPPPPMALASCSLPSTTAKTAKTAAAAYDKTRVSDCQLHLCPRSSVSDSVSTGDNRTPPSSPSP